MKEIPLTQGKVALVDDEDFELVSQFKWAAHKNRNRFYAVRGFCESRTKSRKTISMHRFILNPKNGLFVDHINQNGLDNRRCNIRIATACQNMSNRRQINTLGYKGIRLVRSSSKPFAASICADKKWIYIGVYPTAEEAARAYDQKAIELHGEFAYLNFPNAPNGRK